MFHRKWSKQPNSEARIMFIINSNSIMHILHPTVVFCLLNHGTSMVEKCVASSQNLHTCLQFSQQFSSQVVNIAILVGQLLTLHRIITLKPPQFVLLIHMKAIST